MKNNDERRFEVLVIIILMASLFVCITCFIFNNSNTPKKIIMKRNSEIFGNVASTNKNFFNNKETVYLKELVDEGYISKVKSPFSKNNCSEEESKVEFNNNKYLVTLKCDNYLIDKYDSSNDKENYKLYKVSDWQDIELQGNNVEKKTLYNCSINGKENYSKYYEELYLVYLINLDYKKEYHELKEVNECTIVKKEFYRTKKLIK